ncbi:MAG: fumarylacetoacetate hydrolase family protein [Gammaproteobacteria bacterium]
MNEAQLQQAAAILARARLDNELIGPLPDTEGLDETRAYAIQDRLHERLSAELGPISGHKIGCTTPVMQRYLKIHQPCAGGVFANTAQRRSGRCQAPPRGRIGVECEIAVLLGEDLPASGAPYDRARVAPAVEACIAAMELVADRYHDYGSLGVYTLIADDFFNCGCVLGDPVRDWQALDLAAIRGRMWINDAQVGEGSGADVMGHPFNALAWLANRYAELRRPLLAGQFVLLGSVVQTQWLKAGDRVRVAIDGLGGAMLAIEG